MKALQWFGPRDLRLTDVARPVPAAGEVLIRVDAVGICGTDLEEYLDGPVATAPVPGQGLILGHEVVGTVVESPEGLWQPGQRVIPDVVVGCGDCLWCDMHEEGLCQSLRVRGLHIDGGLAEYMLADAATCLAVPADLAPTAAVFAEPTAVAVRALRKVPSAAGQIVAVTGLGTIGNLIAQVALAQGATAVIGSDPSPAKRALAKAYGVVTCEPADLAAGVMELSAGNGAGVAIECSGSPSAVSQCVAVVRRGGTVVLVGLRNETAGFPLVDVVLGEKKLAGSAAHLWDLDVAPALDLLASGTVRTDALLSGRTDLDGAVAQGFERLHADPDIMKIVIEPHGSTE